MTTWETRDEKYGCPCGTGAIVITIESPADSGYGRAQIQEHIECDRCVKMYRLRRTPQGYVLNLNSELEQRSFVWSEADRLSASIKSTLVSRIVKLLQEQGRKSVEWHLVARRIFGSACPSDATEFQKRLKRPGGMAAWVGNAVTPAGFESLVAATQQQADLQPLLAQLRDAERAARSVAVRDIPLRRVR